MVVVGSSRLWFCAFSTITILSNSMFQLSFGLETCLATVRLPLHGVDHLVHPIFPWLLIKSTVICHDK